MLWAGHVTSQEKRLKPGFETAPLREKLETLASNPYDDVKEMMPSVEDTIESIRQRLYLSKTENREEKFLLDQVDVNRATDEENDGAALYILENALRLHVSGSFDSLYSFKMIRTIIETNKNDAVLMKQYQEAAARWGGYFAAEEAGKYAGKRRMLIPLPFFKSAPNDTTGYMVAGLILLLLVIAMLAAYIIKFKRREKQLSIKNNQIQVQHKQIEQSLREKEALIREIHHRVKNNLQIINSMLNLQIGKLSDEKTESIFFEAKQRISAIALTHQMLYQKETLSNINLSEYIETLVRQIEASMSSPFIELEVDVKDQKSRLTIDGAVPLGLVINELLTNAYKHAFPKGRKGKITVSLNETPESFTITVADNGVGLPTDFNYADSTTLGMELVYILVDQLDSKLQVENGNGTTFKFEIQKISRYQ
jgi:two-component sensor histidine kinase